MFEGEPDGVPPKIGCALGAAPVSYTFPANACLVFKIEDSYGDGMCCNFGNGSFTVTDANGTVLASGGGFDDSESIMFRTATNTVGIEEINQSMKAPVPVCMRCVNASCGIHIPEMERVFGNIGKPQFKGSGFYATDYKKKGFSKPDKKVKKSRGKKSEGNKKKQK